MSVSLAICGLALVIEALVGYPASLFAAIGHPVTWIGRALAWLDRRLNREELTPARRRELGAVAVGGLVLAIGLVAALISMMVFAILPLAAAILLLGLVASSGLAQRSLDAHVRAVADALETLGVEAGRAAVAQIVGRDVRTLNAAGVASAAIESLAENFADGIVAPAFWLALLGLPGLAAYKAINTADSMVGHRTPRHAAFGFFAAKLDDVVNWPAARLAALFVIAASRLVPGAAPGEAWRIMWRDAKTHPSPNAGWPEAAMAGALGVQLGGPRSYGGGTVVETAAMGVGGRPSDAAAIWRALTLYRVACGLQIATVVVFAVLIARW